MGLAQYSASITPETTTIIGKREFNLMRKTAFIINTSRGSVINEADLIQAIKNKDNKTN